MQIVQYNKVGKFWDIIDAFDNTRKKKKREKYHANQLNQIITSHHASQNIMIF